MCMCDSIHPVILKGGYVRRNTWMECIGNEFLQKCDKTRRKRVKSDCEFSSKRSDQYERCMLRWLDCRARMNDNQNANKIYKRGVNGLRGGGRPRNSWWHEVDNS